MEVFADAETSLKYTTHPRVVFETAAVKAALPQADYDIDALTSRIKALEDKLAKGDFTVRSEQPSQSRVLQENRAETPASEAKTVSKEPETAQPVSGEKPLLSSSDAATVRGKLLSGLRRTSEMLWSVMQGVEIAIKNNVLMLYPVNSGDFGILDMQVNKDKIADSLSEYQKFEINVKEPNSEKKLSEVDEASEKLKKIFGDDIVVVKY